MPATETQVKLKPIGDRVILEVLDDAEKSEGGIYIPDSAREKPQRGRVLAVGKRKLNDGREEELYVKVGEVVLFAKYGGTDVKLGDREYKILSEKDILAVIEG
ncbi:MAG: co-chaperone GroES [Candidatus Melainabacteria bacterium]|nr:co-chaperone GroES [Candidatus Melainabacteria bacterium]